MKSALLSLAVASLLGTSAYGAGLGFQCVGDSLHVSLWLTGDAPAGAVANVRASVIGSCDPGVTINPEPIPFPEPMTQISVDFTVPTIDSGRYLKLEIYGVDAGGHEFAVGDSGDLLHYCMAACSANAVFGRGRIVDLSSGMFLLEPCADHCWEPMPLWFVEAEPGWESYVGTGQVVNVYGEAFVDGMPGGTLFRVSRLAPELDPAGCEAVAEASLTWGSLKGMFR